jgi:CheY-like chemotaxis protein
MEEDCAYSQRGSHMHMLKIDGFELVERIRQRGQLSTSTIMMLTSAGHRCDAQRCKDLGWPPIY